MRPTICSRAASAASAIIFGAPVLAPFSFAATRTMISLALAISDFPWNTFPSLAIY
jgi:hypothetical protein